MICDTCDNRFSCIMNHTPDRKECSLYESTQMKFELYFSVKEEFDRFVFESITPYCLEITRNAISKEDIKSALMLWMQAKSGNNSVCPYCGADMQGSEDE